MGSRVLTDVFIRALKPAPAGKRYAVSDAVVPGLRVRVTERGTKTFILWRRLRRGARTATALVLGRFGELTLAQARVKAREWIVQIVAGKDPRVAERATRANTFAVVMEDYLARHVRGRLRKAADVEREMRGELLSRWKDQPLATITRADIIRMVDEIKGRGAVYQAHNMLSHCKCFFGWCVERGVLEHSPADHISRNRLIGARKSRTRVLNDDEIASFWTATEQLKYPFDTAFKLLLLTGQRRNEVVGAHWSEFDLPRQLWTVPAERFKSNATHLVPLSDAVMALLMDLPRWTTGDHLFSFNGGRAPLQHFSAGKAQLDKLMSSHTNSQIEGAPPISNFVTHDLRRTVRTRLAALKVPDRVAEMVIGHGSKGLQRVYDQHMYLDEMRDALTLWALCVQKIVSERI
jgi:integrase